MNDDLKQKQQEAIAQALEMYERAQRKQGNTANNINPPNRPAEVEVEISENPNTAPLNTTQGVLEIPAEEQGSLSDLAPFEEEDSEPAPFLNIDKLRETQYPKRDVLEPFDWELEEEDDDFLMLPQEPLQNRQQQASPGANRNSQAGRRSQNSNMNNTPNSKRGEKGFETQQRNTHYNNNANWERTQGYTEQYYEDHTDSVNGPAVSASSTQNNADTPYVWENTEGYTEQYYEDEDTYEEFSTGHSQESAQTSANPNSDFNRQPQDTMYSNRQNRTNNATRNNYVSQNFDDNAILLLLLFLLVEENKDPELIIILLYLLG